MAKVLVIDDDLSTRDGMVELLELEGHDATAARDGAEGLARLRDGGYRPDVILLDLQMPGVSGWDFVATMDRDLTTPPPVIVVSSTPHLAPRSPSVVTAMSKTSGWDAILKAISAALAAGGGP